MALVGIARTFYNGLLEFHSIGGASPSEKRRGVEQRLYATASTMFSTTGGYACLPVIDRQHQLKVARVSTNYPHMEMVRAREGGRDILCRYQSVHIGHIITHSVATYKD